ncbi:PD-(D/E)XK nuclease family protein [Streptomyces sp. NPDC096068]|uniref:PD-(D/E)XK nuclease family protein n=1 Tax=Streptomyces sp. NPDC096068 TaxID=3155424 RepID=UPI00331C50D2
MTTWLPLPRSTGRSDLIRVFAGAARPQERQCPYKTAFKARPGLKPPRGPLPGYKPDPREGFNLGPLNEALDLIEYHGSSVEQALAEVLRSKDGRPAAHPGLARWTTVAVANYLKGGDEGLLPVSHGWVRVAALSKRDERGAARYEECVWGRPYESPDGTVRELRIPVAGPLSEQARDEGELAAASMTVAFGKAHRLPGPFQWKENAVQVEDDFSPAREHELRSVRIQEVSCLDGARRTVSVRTPEEIEREYDRIGKARLAEAVTSEHFAPGFDCEDCKLVPVCPALRRAPGLLGIHDSTRPRRTWSVTNGRSYAGRPDRDEKCAAREHLRRLRLPDRGGKEIGPAVVRGHAVHAWIQEQHERSPGVACRPQDAPEGSESWSAGKWAVTGEEAGIGARMVAAHARHCPYRLTTVAGLVHERSVVMHDTEADVIVIAKADMMYRDGASWVYREIKTDARNDPPLEGDLLRSRPQLALAVLLLESSVADLTLSRVELEVLGPSGSRLTMVDPADPDTRAQARFAVQELVSEWHEDTLAVASPGRHCRFCEMDEWCQPNFRDRSRDLMEEKDDSRPARL